MMTIEEQLAYCDHLEERLKALNAQASAFNLRSYEPKFTLVPADVWGPPHPHDDPPMEWDRVFAASVGAGVTIGCFAIIFEALRRGLL
jgi:hypothetical protein